MGGQLGRHAIGIVRRDHGSHSPARQDNDERIGFAGAVHIEIEPVDIVTAAVDFDRSSHRFQWHTSYLLDLAVWNALRTTRKVVVLDNEAIISARHPTVVVGHVVTLLYR